MCRSALHPFLAALPKCEHHLHLEGCMTPDLLFELAKRNHVALPADAHPAFASLGALRARYAAGFASLDDFLVYYYAGLAATRAAPDFEALAWTYFQHARAANVEHTDLSVDVQAHVPRGVPLVTVVEGVNAARRRAETELGITSALVACFQRHLPPEDARAAYEAEVRPLVRDGNVAGIGLDSSEAAFPDAAAFKPVYEAARADGARLTAHAGEELGPEAVRTTVRELGVERVDHGRTSAADAELLRELKARGIMVTLCPLSNVVLQCVKSVKELPVREFLEHGIKFSLNGDDPAFFGGWTLENWCAVEEAFELSKEQWVEIARNCVHGSWCGDSRKQVINRMIDEAAAS